MEMAEDRITGMVYAALLGETSWRQFLDRFAEEASINVTGLVMHDTRSGDGYCLFSSHGERAMRLYNDCYAKLNVLQLSLAKKPVGTTACDDDLFPRRKLVDTEFFNDYLVPHELTHTAGTKIAHAGSQSFSLVVGCGGTDARPLQRAITGLIEISPHLQRAFQFYGCRKHRQERLAQDVIDLLERPNTGSIVVDSRLTATAVSSAARTLLGERAPLRIFADGRVQFRMQAAQLLCERMLARGYQGPTTMDFFYHRTRMTLVRSRKSAEENYFEGPTLVILLEQPTAETTRFNLTMFAQNHHLSQAEVRALSGIIKGKSVAKVAEDAGLSRETIRSQTKSLYSKIGANSAADVLRTMQKWLTS